MMKKLIIFIALCTALLLSQISLAAPSFQTDSGQAYVVQANDWLSKLADKYYGDPLAYPTIVEATNTKAKEDSSFSLIDNPDLIEIGQKIWIPAASGSIALPPNTTESPPTSDLSGVTWVLSSYGPADAPQTVADDITVTAQFSATDNQLSGTGGCNNYFASFEQNNNRLAISAVGATRMACPEPMMDMETTYFAALEKVDRFEYQTDTLTLTYNDGQDVLVFQPQTAATSSTQDEMSDEMSMSDKEISAGDDSFKTLLKNATYNDIYDIYEKAVTLSEGKYEGDPFVAGGAARPTIVLVEDMTQQGDLNGDGLDDVATILVENSGGSGVFNYLAVVLNQDGTPVNVATHFLGDRVNIKKFFIENGEIGLDMIIQGPDDPFCCPSLSVSWRYALQDGVLVSLDGQVTKSQLANMDYQLDYAETGVIALRQGTFEAPLLPDSALTINSVLVHSTISGDVNGDGKRDGVAILATNTGGTGTFYDLVVVIIQNGQPVHVATEVLGDRPEIKSVFVNAAGEISVDMVTHGDDDPLCCPTVAKTSVYQLQNNQLVERDSSS